MLQLDLSISLNADLSGENMCEGLRIFLDLVEELNTRSSVIEKTLSIFGKRSWGILVSSSICSPGRRT